MKFPPAKLGDNLKELLDEARARGGTGARSELNSPLRWNVATRQCVARVLSYEQAPLRGPREESLVAMLDVGSAGSISLLPSLPKGKRRAPRFSWQPFRRGSGCPMSLQIKEVALGSNPPRRNSLSKHPFLNGT
jgi:hypothetical protein